MNQNYHYRRQCVSDKTDGEGKLRTNPHCDKKKAKCLHHAKKQQMEGFYC